MCLRRAGSAHALLPLTVNVKLPQNCIKILSLDYTAMKIKLRNIFLDLLSQSNACHISVCCCSIAKASEGHLDGFNVSLDTETRG